MLKLTSALLAGTAMTLTITQGGNSASAQVPSWGNPTAGTISIELTRTRGQVAPDSVTFRVNTTQSLFQTPLEHPESTPPGHRQQYYPRYHDLIYLWDFYGDAAWANVPEAEKEWSAPTRLPPGCASRRYGKGPEAMHLYREGGTYVASVLVYEPSSGLWATASTEVEVAKPEDFYLSVVAFDTDSVPAHDDPDMPSWITDRVNAGTLVFDGFQETDVNFSFTAVSAEWKINGGYSYYYPFVDDRRPGIINTRPENGNKTLFLWKRNKTYNVHFNSNSDNISGIDAYGTGDDPIWNNLTSSPRSAGTIRLAPPQGIEGEIHCSNIDLRGGYDPTVAPFSATLPENLNVGVYVPGSAASFIADKITLTGFWDTISLNYVNGIFHCNDFTIAKRGSYGALCSSEMEGGRTGYFGFTGTEIVDAAGTVQEGKSAAAFRVPRSNLLYISHTNATSQVQECYRLQDMSGASFPPRYDSHMYVFDSIGQGGLGVVSTYTNGRNPNLPNLGNTILDGCIFIPRVNGSEHMSYVQGMGVTIRNCIFHSFLGAPASSAIAVQRRGDVDLSDQAAIDAFFNSALGVAPFIEQWRDFFKARVAPNKFYGNTFVHYSPFTRSLIVPFVELIRMVSLRDDPAATNPIPELDAQVRIYSYWPQDQWGDNVESWPDADNNTTLAGWIADGNLAGINYKLDETAPLLDAWGNQITLLDQNIYTYNGPGDITVTPVPVTPAYILSGLPSGAAPDPSGVTRTTNFAMGPAIGETVADWIANEPGDRANIGARKL
ncbi:hypothetical protein [Rhodovulum marinum]|uniref:Uncharacterized protein n=1 Tax=Rhodovulum marinum TaxID=320662 RepID=A0A4R2PWD2_9RHOB|nr:hypothetical protein [Rhodovulum marinum]TCP39574.1 hypothetical protein EV662_11154 [Rhodovulum marinum]